MFTGRMLCVVASASVLALGGCARVSTGPPADIEWPDDVDRAAYPLDHVSRKAPGSGKPRCPSVQLVRYEGDALRYHKPVKVNPFFRDRLQQFELVVDEVARRHYGRPPSAIVHFGTYNCRRVNGKPKLSEHGLGNAIDVAGFRFDADPLRSDPLSKDLRITLIDHWRAKGGVEGTHAEFLHDLARELAGRPDIFRGMLGPGAAGHEDHFHFDAGKWRYLDMDAVR